MMESEIHWMCQICLEFESSSATDWFVATSHGQVYHNSCIRTWLNIGAPRDPNTNQIIDPEKLTRLFGIDPSKRRQGPLPPESNSLSVDGLHVTEPPNYTFKLILLGDSQVGKSSLLYRYTTGSFNFAVTTTLGLDLSFKRVTIGGKHIKLCLWDTGGQERLKAVTKNFVRNAHGVMLVYSYANTESASLKSIEGWMKFVVEYGIPGAAMILVANKSDIPEAQRSSNVEQGQAIARKLGLQFFETSARDEINVETTFRALVTETLLRVEANHLEYRTLEEDRKNRIRLEESTPEKSRNCCC